MEETKNVVLCAASAYEEKYYLNPGFKALPESIKKEVAAFTEIASVSYHAISRFQRFSHERRNHIGVWGDGNLGFIRAEAEAAPNKKLTAMILCGEGREDVVKAGESYIKKLANITEITFISDKKDVPEETMSAVVDGAEVFIPLDDIMDYEAELDRLQKEKKRLEGEVKRVTGKLSNEGFVSKAPEKVVEEERAKKVKYEEMLSKVIERLTIVEAKVK